MPGWVVIRWLLVLGLLILLGMLAALFRRFGLGEFAIVLAVLSFVILIESARFVVTRFIRGLRGTDRTRQS